MTIETVKLIKRLTLIRGIMSFIGWCLMVGQLFVGLIVILISIIRGESIIAQERTIIGMFIISMLIGLMAFIDMRIAKQIRKL